MNHYISSSSHSDSCKSSTAIPRPAKTRRLASARTYLHKALRASMFALFISAGLPLAAQAADSQPPSVPTGLAATAISSTQIKLTWNAAKDNVAVKGYYVYLNDKAVAITSGTSWSRSGLVAGTTYNFRVSAFDAMPNHSAWSAVPLAVTTTGKTPPDTTAPSVPAALTGTAVSNTQINLSWTASTDDIAVKGYYVYVNDVALTTTTSTTFQHTGLAAGTTYKYRVSAFDAVPNHSAWTAAPVSVTTTMIAVPDTTAPSVPSGLSAVAASANQINLSWDASTDNVAVKGYYVYLNDVALGTTASTSYQHAGLAAGTTYNYRVSAFDAVPNHSAWSAAPVSVTTPGTPPAAAAAPISSSALWSCTFPSSPTDCGFGVQEKVPGRASIVNIARDGVSGLRLHTEPGDNNVTGSGDMERADLWLSQADSDGYEGHEAWWGLSVRFPDDFVFPTWHRYALSGFHHTGSTGQGNFTLGFTRGALDTDAGIFGFQGYGGVQDGGFYTAPTGPIAKNIWYDFVYHVKWSSGDDGIFQVWMNGVLKLDHRGPTMYAGQGVYFKLANYHVPLCDPYPACVGSDPPSSVIYDRIVRGPTAASVSSSPLEGALTLVNGVLTPVQ